MRSQSIRSPKLLIWSTVALLIVVQFSDVWAANWQYSGYDKKGSREIHSFFDADSVRSSSTGMVRVWAETILGTDLDRYYRANAKSVDEKAAERYIAFGPVKFLQLPDVKSHYIQVKDLDGITADMSRYEVMANTVDAIPAIRRQNQFLFEIDCSEMKIRTLQGSMVDKQGELGAPALLKQKFAFIPPKTNAAWLAALVCPTH